MQDVWWGLLGLFLIDVIFIIWLVDLSRSYDKLKIKNNILLTLLNKMPKEGQ